MADRMIMDSFNRISERGTRFVERFYEKFTDRDARVKEAFQHVNMDRQKKMLVKSLAYFVLQSDGSELVSEYTQNLICKHHHELKIPNELYTIWATCLIETLWEFDENFDVALEQRWISYLQSFIGHFQLDIQQGQLTQP